MTDNRSQQKKPSPTTETASSDTSVSKPSLTAREQKIISHFGKRLVGDWAVPFPDILLSQEFLKLLGPATRTLLVIMRTCEWDTGVWRGKQEELALWLATDVKTIRNHLNILKRLGVTRKQLPYSMRIFLP